MYLTKNSYLESIKNFQNPVIIKQIIPLQNVQKTKRDIPLRRINTWEISTWKNVQHLFMYLFSSLKGHIQTTAWCHAPLSKWLKLKKMITQNPGYGVEKLVHLCIENTLFKWYSHSAKECQFRTKLNVYLPNNPTTEFGHLS